MHIIVIFNLTTLIVQIFGSNSTLLRNCTEYVSELISFVRINAPKVSSGFFSELTDAGKKFCTTDAQHL